MLCIENNETRGQALLLIESLRAFGGRFARCPVFAVAPRPGLGVDAATRKRLDELEAIYHEAALNTDCPEYGSANRLYAAAWAARTSPAETLFVLDSDTLFLGEPEPLGAEWDLAVRPVDVKGATSEGSDDPFDSYWASMCGLAGMAIEALPFVETVLDRRRVRASYNGGYAVVRRSSGILERAADLFSRSVAADLRPYKDMPGHRVFASTGAVAPRAGEYWGSNQAALAIAAWATTRRVRLLDRRFNVPLHELADGARWSEDWANLGPLHLHYHWLLRAGHRDLAYATMTRLGVADERLAWLRGRAARVDRGGAQVSERAERLERSERSERPERGQRLARTSRPLIVTGMHRSATSLVANLLQRSGVEIGDQLMGPGLGNPRGHFEDRDFYRLHEEMLAAQGTTALAATDELALPLDDAFAERAMLLVERRAAHASWGWKDPRTCLFLEFWDELVPDARYLFLYRHPVEVALSLRRRSTDAEIQLDPWAGIRAWEVSNRRLLGFFDRHPGRCFLAQVPALTLDLGDFLRRVGGKLGLALGESAAAELFFPAELTTDLALQASSPAWEALIPEALALYRRLESAADLPSQPLLAGAAPSPMVTQDALDALERLGRELRATPPLRPPAGAGTSVAMATGRWAVVERRRLGALLAELAAQRRTVAELQRGVAVASSRRDELAAALASIEQSRGHRLVAAAWRLLARLRRAGRPSAG